MFSDRAAKQLSRIAQWLHPTRKGLQEASDQFHGKRSKLRTFDHLTMSVDSQKLAKADRDAVAQFRAQKTGVDTMKLGGQSCPEGDNWVCDEMTINTGGGHASTLLAVALGGLIAWAVFGRDKANVVQQNTPAAASPTDSEYEVRFYDAEGNPIDVPRVPRRAPGQGNEN